MRYLLDTVIVSEYLRKKPAPNVIDWLDNQAEQSLYISQLTVAELKKGYYKLMHRDSGRGEKERAKKIGLWIQKLEVRFAERLLPIDAAVLDVWSTLTGKAEADGRKLPVFDSLLVATAEKYGLTVVTRNVSDFENCSTKINIYDPYLE